jgi:hypothetical protein
VAEDIGRVGPGGADTVRVGPGEAGGADTARVGSGEAGGADTVTSPDQLKPTNVRLARITGTVTIIVLLLMTQPFNNHTNGVDDVFLVGTAAVIAIFLGVDAILRRNGLRR